MLQPNYFLEQYQYTFWANRKVWECVIQLSEEQFRQELDYSIGSIYNHCVHTMGVEYWWLHFLSTGEIRFIDNPEDYKNRSSIRAKWDEVEQMALAYLERLTPEELERDVRPEFWDSGEPAIKVWEALLQVANHSTDHRSQMLAGLHRLGAPTTEQDFLNYVLEVVHKPGEV